LQSFAPLAWGNSGGTSTTILFLSPAVIVGSVGQETRCESVRSNDPLPRSAKTYYWNVILCVALVLLIVTIHVMRAVFIPMNKAFLFYICFIKNYFRYIRIVGIKSESLDSAFS
jgi:hypothetical protein